MTLKSKVLLILTGIFILYGTVDYGIQYFIILPSFLELETNEAIQNLDRCVQAIKNEIYHLDTLCRDWATWDDTYDFVVSRSDEYIKSNLVMNSFSDNNLNLIYICDAEGNVVWGEIYDLAAVIPLKLADFPEDAIPGTHPLFISEPGKISLKDLSVAGVFATSQFPMLIASRPILTSSVQGPMRGFLIMGKFFDNMMAEQLIKQTHVEFKIFPNHPDSLPESMKDIPNRFTRESPYLIERINNEHLNIYTAFPGIKNDTAFLIRTMIPRKIAEKGFTAMRYALVSILFAGIGVLIVMLMLLQKTVLGPITRLTRHILVIKKMDDYSLRLSMKRSDEIGTLAKEFDNLLEHIEKQTNELAKVNGELKNDIAKRMQVEYALQKANRELKNLANLDGLTRIPNRRRFDEYLHQEWKRMAREKKPLALIMCDVDYFKLYNDTYGHQMGDECLCAIAQTIYKNAKRPADMAARYGGEEFILVLPDTDADGAFHVAEAIRTEIQELSIIHEKSPINLHVTLSFGISGMIPSEDFSPEILVNFADKALYEAKIQGRNCCILSGFQSETLETEDTLSQNE